MEPDSASAKPAPHFDPDDYRMTIGEHLEELRMRLILALIGFVVATIVCLIFGRQMISIFCQPLVTVLQKHDISPQLHTNEVADGFMTFIKISLICAAAIAGPWMLLQIWRFVAAGLYPHERKYVTRYIPLSITLFIAGVLFVYFFVLPWTLEFFVAFSESVPMSTTNSVATEPATGSPTFVQRVGGNPPDLIDGQIWYDTVQKRLKIYFGSEIRIIPFGPQNLLAAEYDLPEYIDLVVGMLLMFGLSFQLPLVVLTLERIGIVEIDVLRSARRYVYFAMSILAAVITPGDVITATVALMIPLVLLYELGIFLAVWKPVHKQRPDNG